MRISPAIMLASLLMAAVAIPSSFARPQATAGAEIVPVQGGSGPCTADFTVSDASGKGIYGVKIELQVQWGFMGLHKLDATVNTNADGKARFEGLPDRIKKTAAFQLSYQDQNKSVPYTPESDCHPQNKIALAPK